MTINLYMWIGGVWCTIYVLGALLLWRSYLVTFLYAALLCEEAEWRLRHWDRVLKMQHQDRYYRQYSLPSVMMAACKIFTSFRSYRRPVYTFYYNPAERTQERNYGIYDSH